MPLAIIIILSTLPLYNGLKLHSF